MNVLLVGASGFIGARLARELTARGHTVVGAGRGGPDAPRARDIALDYTAPPDADALQRSLRGFDVAINAVGILRERGAQTFAALHAHGPRALFDACAAAGVRRVIQISALGAEAGAQSNYHRSKYEADRYLVELPLDAVIVQPSLVYGAGGTSAALFDRLAAMPVMPLPAGGRQRMQPVHIDDLVDALVRLVESPAAMRCVLPVVGPLPLSLRTFLIELRRALGLERAPTVSIPRGLVALAARIGDRLPDALLDSETFGMLERGNTGDPAPLSRLLGRPPRPVEQFIAPQRRAARRTAAVIKWLAPLLRASVAAMWLIAGGVSLGAYPVRDSLALLARIGVPAGLEPLLLYGAAGLDIAFGVLTLLPRRPAALWSAQIAVVVAYTAIITWRLPALWPDPFGPVAKNIPILMLLLLLRQLEVKR